MNHDAFQAIRRPGCCGSRKGSLTLGYYLVKVKI